MSHQIALDWALVSQSWVRGLGKSGQYHWVQWVGEGGGGGKKQDGGGGPPHIEKKKEKNTK